MESNPRTAQGNLRKKLMGLFIAGVLIIVPIAATLYLLVWIFQFVDSLLQPLLNLLIGRTIAGVGFVITVVVIMATGLIASSVLGNKLIDYAESWLIKVPIIRPVYSMMRQVADGFSDQSGNGFKQVVLIEYPRKGIHAIGFITNESVNKHDEKFISVYIPSTPNPTAGYFQIVRENDITRTGISVSDALKIVISAGKVSLKEVVNNWPVGY
jgi:uncharacterized membrane protein